MELLESTIIAESVIADVFLESRTACREEKGGMTS